MAYRLAEMTANLPAAYISELERRLAVSALLCHCDDIAASGALPEQAEQSLRKLIVATERAFGMPSKAERAA